MATAASTGKLFTKSGLALHPLGIGTWGVASAVDDHMQPGRYRNTIAVHGNEEYEIAALHCSFQQGQNHVDCAELYGAFYTDEVVGRATVSSGIARENLFIADKLWSHSVLPNAVEATVEQMLTKLQTDYLDLLYIHAPWPDVEWQAALPQIDKLIEAKVVRHLGVSNFTTANMDEARAIADHPIAANQMHFNCLYRDEVNDAFRAYCNDHNIALIAYRPIGRGAVVRHKVLQDIATVHAATPSQIALAWLLNRGALPIPKAMTVAHIDENIKALEVKLSDSDMKRIDAL